MRLNNSSKLLAMIYLMLIVLKEVFMYIHPVFTSMVPIVTVDFVHLKHLCYL